MLYIMISCNVNLCPIKAQDHRHHLLAKETSRLMLNTCELTDAYEQRYIHKDIIV